MIDYVIPLLLSMCILVLHSEEQTNNHINSPGLMWFLLICTAFSVASVVVYALMVARNGPRDVIKPLRCHFDWPIMCMMSIPHVIWMPT
jgi:hypothetical protein